MIKTARTGLVLVGAVLAAIALPFAAVGQTGSMWVLPGKAVDGFVRMCVNEGEVRKYRRWRADLVKDGKSFAEQKDLKPPADCLSGYFKVVPLKAIDGLAFEDWNFRLRAKGALDCLKLLKPGFKGQSRCDASLETGRWVRARWLYKDKDLEVVVQVFKTNVVRSAAR